MRQTAHAADVLGPVQRFQNAIESRGRRCDQEHALALGCDLRDDLDDDARFSGAWHALDEAEIGRR